ncbi:flagellar filament core protein flaB2 domain protein [Leptospira terpstrae]|uniref:flagellar filament core protein flaB2 domain protein n=1 Tax=Leptospira terpstrae TaxID=293075 RepID=UPI003D01F0F8
MKLPYNLIQSVDTQRESIIQKQILKIRKEISQWDDKYVDTNLGQKEILLRIDTKAHTSFWIKFKRNSEYTIDSRLKFISLTTNALERLYQSQPANTTFQKQTFLIKKTLVYLDTLLAITNRISVISKSKRFDKTNQLNVQEEVTELIDEVDRIASLAEFHQMRLFGGDYAKSSRTASMWFINEQKEELFRIFISTMTSKALGLMGYDGSYLTFSNPILFQKKIEEAIIRITEERKRIQSVLD